MSDNSMCIICGVSDGCRCKACGVSQPSTPESTKPSSVPAQPCTCCNDLAQAAAAFADSMRANNHEDAERHRAKYCEILIKHVTDDKPLAQPEVKRDRFDEFADEVEARVKFFTGSPELTKNLPLKPLGFTKKDMAHVARQWFVESDSDYADKCAEAEDFKRGVKQREGWLEAGDVVESNLSKRIAELESELERVKHERDEALEMSSVSKNQVVMSKASLGKLVESAKQNIERAESALEKMQPQIKYVMKVFGCPCGARPEDLDHFPHVIGCGFEEALALGKGE